MSHLALLPPDVSVWLFVLLAVVSFFTSGMTAAMGLGGGVALLAVMASVLPPAALIPVHGVIQLGSNVGRAVVQRRYVVWTLVLPFVIGSLIGAFVGGQTVVTLPGWLLKSVVGLFVLYATWAPKLKLGDLKPAAFGLGGAIATFLTMFVGASGPFVGALLAPKPIDRLQMVGTFAVCMTLQHGLKILAFGLLGFAFAPWIGLIAAMVATGFLGTLAGTRLLHRLPEATFRLAFKWLMTVLAAELLISTAWSLL
ncbi:Sulfite exporter TauE/SafE [Tistlia consotensis]|uniref:Probable membrane transporter protein n=1 Tax=Tistlia consotensis USBA 355 TaxID=560819 RepID=A0A1Y6C6N0_9PROT|nr:sulfite exporter TauE/SafE family protein [Tistlia consotensis]SMF46698.1 Sulfite exporter TauE/SafE [Tistlia consotensis USBA 355]SNR78119.1 Sulfite exporter TauE/SafE [Tistlia consotensis]